MEYDLESSAYLNQLKEYEERLRAEQGFKFNCFMGPFGAIQLVTEEDKNVGIEY